MRLLAEPSDRRSAEDVLGPPARTRRSGCLSASVVNESSNTLCAEAYYHRFGLTEVYRQTGYTDITTSVLRNPNGRPVHNGDTITALGIYWHGMSSKVVGNICLCRARSPSGSGLEV